MGLGAIARQMIPPSTRARLRRSAAVRWMLSKVYGGEAAIKHPLAPYTFYFDRVRHPGWAAGGVDEQQDMKFALALIQRLGCRCAWDIGANVGAWSLMLAGTKPPIEKVVSFEPDPTNLHYLKMNVDRNGLDGAVNVQQLALSDHDGEATFYSDPLTGCTGSLEKGSDFIGRNYGVERKTIQVRLTTIDSEIAAGLPVPDFMKIDVEGHELPLLRGGSRLLAEHHPVIVMEVTRNHDEVTALLLQHGYKLFGIEKRNELEIAEFATAAIHGSALQAAGF